MFKRYQKRSFWVIILLMALVGGGISAGFFYGVNWLNATHGSQGGAWLSDQIRELVELGLKADFYTMILPATILAFLLLGVVVWMILTLFISGVFKDSDEEQGQPAPQATKKKKDFIDHKIEQERKRRVYLHTLSVLQREGRLLDFFDENLNNYDDSQIGAAVRSIQEDCKKAMKKYIDPKPVLSGVEGDEISIEDGFDIDAINLVGNVSGKPPFKGIIKHPGWKAGKKEVPKLSDIQDPGIMTPAEVEVQ